MRRQQSYSGDLTDEESTVLEPLIPPAKPEYTFAWLSTSHRRAKDYEFL